MIRPDPGRRDHDLQVRVTNKGGPATLRTSTSKRRSASILEPTAASAGGTLSAKTVTWPVVPRLAPKQSVTYTVVGRAVSAGDHRMETQVTTAERTNPIVELESTTFY